MTILEAQVVVLDDEVSDLEVDLTELEGDVNFLFEETIIQDERIFSLEQTTIAIDADLIRLMTNLEVSFTFYCSQHELFGIR